MLDGEVPTDADGRPPLPALGLLSVLLATLLAGCAGTPRGECIPTPEPGAVGSICGFANPEDVEVVPQAALLLVSEMRFAGRAGGGSLAALSLDEVRGGRARPRRLWPPATMPGEPAGPLEGDPSCSSPPRDLAPHGITHVSHADGIRVAVVNHGERESVELFDLLGAGAGARLAWRGCAPLPPETSANDVALAPNGAVVVSNMLPEPPTEPSIGVVRRMLAARLFGRTTGDVMVWTKAAGWRRLPGTEAALPNGVAVSADGSRIYYAEAATGRIVRVPRDGLATGRPEAIHVGGSPDNLSWSSRGTLLVATHTGNGFVACAFGRTPCRSSWAVFEIDPVAFTATKVVEHDGEVVGAVASVTDDGTRWFFGSVYDDRIGTMIRAGTLSGRPTR